MYMFFNKNGNKMSRYVDEINNENIYDEKFNTSMTKIFDNLIMTYVKKHKGQIYE